MKITGIYLIFIFLVGINFFAGCRSDRSKAKLDHTTPLCNNKLFVEVYTIFGGGAFGGDRVSDYLTDSTNFRIYIGTFDNADNGYSFECNGDSIYVHKIEKRSPKNKILSTKIYIMSELKKQAIFE